MSITRAQIETVLVAKLGKTLTFCGLDGTTTNGTNASLTDPLAWAMRQAGYALASPVAVVDADLVAVDDVDEVIDFASLRAAENALGNFDAVDISVGPRSESYDQMRTGLERMIDRQRATLSKKYGLDVGGLESGVIALDFAAKANDEVT